MTLSDQSTETYPTHCSECERRIKVSGIGRGYRWQNHAHNCSRRGLRPDCVVSDQEQVKP